MGLHEFRDDDRNHALGEARPHLLNVVEQRANQAAIRRVDYLQLWAWKTGLAYRPIYKSHPLIEQGRPLVVLAEIDMHSDDIGRDSQCHAERLLRDRAPCVD